MTKTEAHRNFIDNLEKERIGLGLTQSQMAAALDISLSGYKKIIAGETNKLDLFLGEQLCTLTGKFLPELFGKSTPAIRHMRSFKQLTKSQQSFIEGIIDFELKFQQHTKNREEFITVFTPMGNFDDGMLWDSANIDKVNAAPYIEKFGELIDCGIRVTSNNLHPVYHSGDILLICQKPPRDGDIGIFINRETCRAYVRKFRQTNPCQLIPINDTGRTFYIDSNSEKDMAPWIKFGYVLCKMRLV